MNYPPRSEADIPVISAEDAARLFVRVFAWLAVCATALALAALLAYGLSPLTTTTP